MTIYAKMDILLFEKETDSKDISASLNQVKMDIGVPFSSLSMLPNYKSSLMVL